MTNKSKSRKMEEMVPTRTAQHCAQCTAHGKISLLKGHKKVCPFKECRCVHCVLVNNKRQIMAKQVKLKRLQERNHARQRRREERNAALCEALVTSPDKKLDVYVESTDIDEIRQYQEEALRSICGSSNVMPPPFEDQVPARLSNCDQWYQQPVTSVQYSHPKPLIQLQNQTNALILQPCYPVASSAAAVFTTPVGEPEVLPVNHVLTQPMYYPWFQPGCPGENPAQDNQHPSLASCESYLQPLEVVSFVGATGTMQSIDAAQALLTLHTGEE